MWKLLTYSCCLLAISSCASLSNLPSADFLISGGVIYDGTDSAPTSQDIAICGEIFCDSYIVTDDTEIVDASEHVVVPGFIDPHTHAFSELISDSQNANVNYLTQGVTTVVVGNDGQGQVNLKNTIASLNPNGIGTNVAFFIGHGELRKAVIGSEDKEASSDQILKMQQLLSEAMREGALGLSSGLYYVPGSFASTEEVIELAKTAARYDGIYDTHLRDESTFNIGFINAVKEAIEIAETANIHLHLAHIKALGVDVWGQSSDAIELINSAQSRGVSISADQYPWQASGTFLRSAVVPKWVMAGSREDMLKRLLDNKLLPQIKEEIAENIRRRGGPDALLVTASPYPEIMGKTLEDIANDTTETPVEVVINLVSKSRTRVASFNMNLEDIINFMTQPWVVTSSDGTDGHPRKYASFPRKYTEYVVNKRVIDIQTFIRNSTGKTADILRLKKRGYIKPNYFADVAVIDLNSFSPNASFSAWNQLSNGVKFLFVNGRKTIYESEYTGELAGKALTKSIEIN